MLRLDWNMVITIVNLIVLCLLLKKFLIGPVTAVMEQRAALIEQQLADAKNDKQAAGDLKASYEEKLKTSDAESIRIVGSPGPAPGRNTTGSWPRRTARRPESWKMRKRPPSRSGKRPWRKPARRSQAL